MDPALHRTRVYQKVLGFFLAFLFSTLVGFSQVSADITTGLKMRYTMDTADMASSVVDSSGNNYHGTLNLGASAKTLVTGILGQALRFDGVDDWIRMNYLDPLQGMQSGSISMWVKWSGTQSAWPGQNIYGAIVARQRDYVYTAQVLSINSSNPATGKIQWAPYSWSPTLTGTTNVGNDQWRHVVITFTDGSHKLYVDGALDGQTTDSGTINSVYDSQDLAQLGTWRGIVDANGAYFKGDMDDVRIYSRVLSASDVAELYAAGSGPAVTTGVASSIAVDSAVLGANNTSSVNVSSRGFAYGTSANLSTSVSTTTESGDFAAGTYTASVSGLSAGTTYYFRAYVSTGSSIAYGTIQSFTTSANPTAPVVVTSPATTIGTSTVRLNGNVTDAGAQTATAHGFAYGTSANLSTTIATTTLGTKVGTGTFNATYGSLTPGTTYYFRAYSTNNTGTSYGEILSFNTLAITAPSVTTQAAGSVSTSTAVLNSNITSDGNASSTVRGFVYGLTTAYGATTTISGSFGLGVSSSTVTGLQNNSTYHFKAYATNSAGTGYGSDLTLTTTVGSSAIVTNAVTAITTTGAVLNATLSATGGQNPSEHGFAWGRDLATTTATTTLGTKSGAGAFSETLSGLTCSTTYYVRAYSTNSVGTSFGAPASFRTLSCSGTSSTSGTVSTPTTESRSTRSSGSTSSSSGDVSVPTSVPVTLGTAPASTTRIIKVVRRPVASPTVASSETVRSAPVINPLLSFNEKYPEIVKIFNDFDLSELMQPEGKTVELPSVDQLKEVPKEVVVAKEVPALVTFMKEGELEQKIEAPANTKLSLAVRPVSDPEKVTGYLLFRGNKKANQKANLSAALANAQVLKTDPKKSDTEMLIESFKYLDGDKDGVYTAEITTPAVEGTYEVVTLISYKDKNLGSRELRLVTVIDPEGYVYYLNSDKEEVRIKGATVSIVNAVTGEVWDSSAYNQLNPQVTDESGKYAFLVPEGKYYLEATASGFAKSQSNTFDVNSGKGIHINIQMKKKYLFFREYLVWKIAGLVLL